ncbi:MAG: 1-(5-phosphoribosyl)-5-[(5-phosphoribosylamino)methylideneamino]imidazole-4-carboxamide isomerase [Terricaulis sp.]
MLIYPAIDLMGGKCVRLALGNFDHATTYGDPWPQLEMFADKGATWVHVVDLDGAREGRPMQHPALANLARRQGVKIQCGGGVRERADVERLLDAGVSRVVVGSAAVKRPHAVLEWIADLGVERVCCAFDARPVGEDYEVVVHGWVEGGGVTLRTALNRYAAGTLKHVLVTDVSRDGVLTGSNAALMKALVKFRPDLALQASGGVSSLSDLQALQKTGAAGAIVGRALYEKRFSLEEALAL